MVNTGGMNDNELRNLVLEELEWEPSVDAAHIGVVAQDGVVTLSGFVENFAEKMAAERAARRVKGVRAIAEEIEVRVPSHRKGADDEIAHRAVSLLNWDIEVPGERLGVKVEHGVVTLTGDVDWQFQKHAAERDIRRLSGVTGVINAIVVRPSVAPSAVRERIEAALRRHAELEATGLEVAVSGGMVTLRGTVNTAWERSAAEDAAWAAPGVSQVVNQIAVRR